MRVGHEDKEPFFSPGGRACQADRCLHSRRAMMYLVKRSRLGLGILSLVCFARAASAQAPSPSPWSPALPVGKAAPGPTSGSPGAGSSGAEPYEESAAPEYGAARPSDTVASPQPTAQQLYDHVLRGVVALERNGVPMAIGTVLSGDGRVLTALSGLSGAEGADVRYADGTLVHAKVGRSDRASDLALLVPQSLKWTEGLTASDADPSGLELRAMLPAHGTHLGPALAGVKGQVDAHTREGAALSHMLEVELKGPSVAGAPLLDSAGGVVAVLVRACRGPASPAESEDASGSWYPTSGAVAVPPARATCRPVVLGAPVSAIRSFLSPRRPRRRPGWGSVASPSFRATCTASASSRSRPRALRRRRPSSRPPI